MLPAAIGGIGMAVTPPPPPGLETDGAPKRRDTEKHTRRCQAVTPATGGGERREECGKNPQGHAGGQGAAHSAVDPGVPYTETDSAARAAERPVHVVHATYSVSHRPCHPWPSA